ncbi:zinc-finger domain-containing protein [Metabacillus sp. GX 13764]|uniref:zinc-finger domain-containing protein n=1 Tax=Metabacillus kandeliae TaxID=2900151 RepID=UPI001E4FA942|nr:zinc-finger domain-containing protein [Metabacillus kandeliae]MCD7033438.1 zinc-finger domain-containing protein [Metabacillus kandeliae]
MEQRKQLLDEIGTLLDTYCVDCLLKQHFRKEFGKAYAHQFCIAQCTVGQKLKKMGNKLS